MTKSNLSTKNPLTGNRRSHSNIATKMRQKTNKHSKKINGVKVTLTAKEWKTLNKNNTLTEKTA